MYSVSQEKRFPLREYRRLIGEEVQVAAEKSGDPREWRARAQPLKSFHNIEL